MAQPGKKVNGKFVCMYVVERMTGALLKKDSMQDVDKGLK